MTHYWIFKKDLNSGKIEMVCNGAHDTAEECSAHWQGYMYAFMDASQEMLGENRINIKRGYAFEFITAEKKIEYFMEFNNTGYKIMEDICND